MRDLPRSNVPSGDGGRDGDSDEPETAIEGNGQTPGATPRRPWRPAHARRLPAPGSQEPAAGPGPGRPRPTVDDPGTGPGSVADFESGEAPSAPGAGAPGDPGGGHDGAEPEDGGPGKHAKRRKQTRSLRRTILEWVGVIGGGVVIALVIEALLVQAFWIPSPSMAPTLKVGDRVLVNKLSYRLHDVHRGDVIVFERPPGASQGGGDQIKDLIKRVVAVEGDTIEGRDQLVYVNGERVEESYLDPGTPTDNLPRQTIPEDHVFVMGDNRTNSEDSRVFGPVNEDRIIGRAFLRVLPVGDIGWL